MTPHLNDGSDVTVGYVTGDYGKELFKYRYDRESKTLHVHTSWYGRRRELAGTGIGRLNDEELNARLIEMAQEVYENLLADPPIK